MNEPLFEEDEQPQAEHFSMKMPRGMAGLRLDQALTELLGTYSRARIQEWMRGGEILVNGSMAKPKDKTAGDENIDITIPRQIETVWRGQNIPLDIVYEDADLIVVNKPAGLVVHPGAGTPDNTLVNALLYYEPRLAELPRAGIIHRLDKDTSGLLVVARRLSAHAALVEQLQARRFVRRYQTVINGVLISGGSVDAPIGRHPRRRTHMAVVAGGKEAVTHYRVIQRYRAHTHVEVRLETGRTHQIRVHMAHLGHPVCGDPVYGGRVHLPPAASDTLRENLYTFKRQALHAERLGLEHPAGGKYMEWRAELPEDMRALLAALQNDADHT